MPSKHLIFCHPPLLPSIFPSFRVFSSESALHIRWPKYWSFSFSISPSNEYSGLISYRMDWLVGSPCSSRDSQESSPTPQFKSINSSVLSFLYGPTLTSIHDGRQVKRYRSNKQIWPWSTILSKAKANRVLPREYIGHSKHPPPTTQETTLHMDITR